jgi:hypothetical protein
MPETKIALLVASLWHVRAQCESQLRNLTEAQRLADMYRDADTSDVRLDVKNQLLSILTETLTSNGYIRSTIERTLPTVTSLPDNLVASTSP